MAIYSSRGNSEPYRHLIWIDVDMKIARKQRYEPWPELSSQAKDIMRQGAEFALTVPPEWMEELDVATLSAEGAEIRDPVLVATVRKSNRVNILHWAAENIKSPGCKVNPQVGPEMTSVARDLVRRGATESILHAFRAGQSIGWQKWMTITFQLTDDPKLLKELLEFSSISMAYYVDETIRALAGQIALERKRLSQDMQADQREVIDLVLNHEPITEQVASQRLGYRLDGVHRAFIIWSDGGEGAESLLDDVVQTCIRAAGEKRALSIVANGGTRWIWYPGKDVDTEQLKNDLAGVSAVRVAMGWPHGGLEGFRRSHQEAIRTQQIMSRAGHKEQFADFEQVRLFSLFTREDAPIRSFVEDTLGALLDADEILQKSVYVFLQTGCNAARAAQILGLHRNTLNRHMDRAEELLPQPLDACRIQVGVALEILRWMPVR